jgi:DNA polymerase-3 subunit epsilon
MNSPAQESPSDPAWVVIDVETTGLSPREHRIAEVAVIVLDLQGNALGEASTLIDPGGDLGPAEGHGITPGDIAGAPRFEALAGWLQQWLMGKVVVGHNLLFTSAFLDEEFRRAGIDMPHVPVICTMTHAPRYLPSISGRTLEQCCAAADIQIGEPRSALTRARAAAALFRRFLTHRSTLPSPWVDNLAKARRMAWPATPTREFPLVNRRAKPAVEPAATPAAATAPARAAAGGGDPLARAAVSVPASSPKVSGSASVPSRPPADDPVARAAKPAAARATVPLAKGVSGSAKVPVRGELVAGSAKVPAPGDPARADAEEFVAEVIDNAPRQPDESGPVSAYLGALDSAVSDRVLSFTEAIHLKDLAAALAIFESEQADAHRTYLRTLAATAWTDRQMTDGERTDLLTVGKLLDVPEAEVERVIADAKPTARPATGSAAVAPPAAAAAWYPDPYGAARLRWWDGSVWTQHVHT